MKTRESEGAEWSKSHRQKSTLSLRVMMEDEYSTTTTVFPFHSSRTISPQSYVYFMPDTPMKDPLCCVLVIHYSFDYVIRRVAMSLSLHLEQSVPHLNYGRSRIYTR